MSRSEKNKDSVGQLNKLLEVTLKKVDQEKEMMAESRFLYFHWVLDSHRASGAARITRMTVVVVANFKVNQIAVKSSLLKLTGDTHY